jgi:hypothetical protein
MCRIFPVRSTLTRLLFLALYLAAVSSANASPSANDRADRTWHAFRQQNPNFIQTVALSAPNASGERILIISEPPPTLPRERMVEGLQSVFGKHLEQAQLKRTPEGVDGWVEDIVARIVYSANDGRELQENLAKLARQLFGTTYKFEPLVLPMAATNAPPARGPANLSIPAVELDKWLLTPDAPRLNSLDSNESLTLRELLKGHGHPGVYFTADPGVVVLVIPRDRPLRSFRADIRKFSIDTDAIIGAIAMGTDRLAIIGRERDTDLQTVPPLRAETWISLAASRESELGQSYERLAAFAGKLSVGSDRGKDWAPIYLSIELVNTEFGALLNLTDQLLKSWSEAGHVTYAAFNYPKPTQFPFVDGALHYLGTDTLTYNWNTVGVGSIIRNGDAQIFSLDRTGSLPVSYFPEDVASTGSNTKVMSAEDKAFNFFSGLRDPNLQRVVQYTALYQIFRAFPLTTTGEDYSRAADYQKPGALLAQRAELVLRKIKSGQAKVSPANVDLALELQRESGSSVPRESKTKLEMSRSSDDSGQTRSELEEDLQSQVDSVQQMLEETQAIFGIDPTVRLAQIVADRQSIEVDSTGRRKSTT